MVEFRQDRIAVAASRLRYGLIDFVLALRDRPTGYLMRHKPEGCLRRKAY
jgi:hypothetical protein